MNNLCGIFAIFALVSQAAAQGSNICDRDGTDFLLEVVTGGGIRTITTAGCPHYDWTGQTTPDDPLLIRSTYTIPLNPTICANAITYVGAFTDLTSTTRNADPILDAIGIAFNGVPIFSNADVDGQDAYLSEGETLNECNGHPAFNGQYHYHTQVPDECLFELPLPNAHSDLFAFMADGIPLYGPLGDDGIVPIDLDECNGHVDITNPFYHYHVAAGYVYPYTVNCLRGAIDATIWTTFETLGTCEEAPAQYDYSSLTDVWKDINLGLTEGPTSAPTSAPTMAVTRAAPTMPMGPGAGGARKTSEKSSDFTLHSFFHTFHN